MSFPSYIEVFLSDWLVCSEEQSLGAFSSVLRRIKKGGTLCSLGVVAFSFCFFLSSSVVERLFTIRIHFLPVAFFLYLCIRVFADFYAMALQSRSQLKPFFFLVPIQAALSFFLQYSLASLWGIPGLLGGLSLSYLLTVSFALPRAFKKEVVLNG